MPQLTDALDRGITAAADPSSASQRGLTAPEREAPIAPSYLRKLIQSTLGGALLYFWLLLLPKLGLQLARLTQRETRGFTHCRVMFDKRRVSKLDY